MQRTPNATLANARIELNHWLQGCARTTVDGPKQHYSTACSTQRGYRFLRLRVKQRDSTADDTVSGGMLCEWHVAKWVPKWRGMMCMMLGQQAGVCAPTCQVCRVSCTPADGRR